MDKTDIPFHPDQIVEGTMPRGLNSAAQQVDPVSRKIPSALEEQLKANTVLLESISLLESKLQPVLEMLPEALEKESGETAPVNIADIVNMHTRMTRQAIRRLNKVIDRLQL